MLKGHPDQGIGEVIVRESIQALHQANAALAGLRVPHEREDASVVERYSRVGQLIQTVRRGKCLKAIPFKIEFRMDATARCEADEFARLNWPTSLI